MLYIEKKALLKHVLNLDIRLLLNKYYLHLAT